MLLACQNKKIYYAIIVSINLLKNLARMYSSYDNEICIRESEKKGIWHTFKTKQHARILFFGPWSEVFLKLHGTRNPLIHVIQYRVSFSEFPVCFGQKTPRTPDLRSDGETPPNWFKNKKRPNLLKMNCRRR